MFVPLLSVLVARHNGTSALFMEPTCADTLPEDASIGTTQVELI